MDVYNFLRAKSNQEENDKNLLLKDHTLNLIDKVGSLKEFVERNKSKINLDKSFGNDYSEFFENLSVAAFLHDLGKINFSFQKGLFKREKDRKNYKGKLEGFFGSQEYESQHVERHEILSLVWSVLFLGNDEDSKKIRTAILLHHYNIFYNQERQSLRSILDNYPSIKDYISWMLKNKEKIKKFLDSLLKEAKDKKDFPDINYDFEKLEELSKAIKNEEDDISQHMKIKKLDNELTGEEYNLLFFLGCLRRCDYSASGDIEIERKKDISQIFEGLDEKIKNMINNSGGHNWQEEILGNISNKSTVLVAPTGCGKTEFALMWANNQGRKLIYTLPLRVALNDLSKRFGGEPNLREKGSQGYFKKEDVDILHSTAFIEYVKEQNQGRDLKIENQMNSAKIFSSPVLLSTPDQVFLSSLKYYGFDKLLPIYSASVIVIDEIQAYNPEMAAVIIKTLELIKKFGGKILIITATFPPYFRGFINDKNNEYQILDLKKEKEKVKGEIKNYGRERHKIRVKDSPLFEYNDKLSLNEDSLESIIQHLKEFNGSTMIITNNVMKSKELYEKLQGPDKEELFLLNSRLTEKEKRNRIDEIKNRLRKGEKTVLISTQMVEASVDVDFDHMVTEISPIDSQIQRWGRVNRNKKNSVNIPNVTVFTNFNKDKGSKAVYDSRTLIKTKEILEKNEGKVLDYESERNLLEDVFQGTLEEGKTLHQYYVDEINKNLEYLKYLSAEKRSEAQKIFRRIGGERIVFPQLMEMSKEEWIKIFGKIVKETGFARSSWEEIIEELRKRGISFEKEDNEVKWDLKKVLYDNSVNVPEYYLQKSYLRQGLISHEFKGFNVSVIKENDVYKLKEFGLDSVKDDIENRMIEEFSDNIQ